MAGLPFDAWQSAASRLSEPRLPETSVVYVGVAGNVRVLTAQGDDVTFTGVLGGTVIPVQAIRVYATNTTATNMVAIY